MVKNRPAMQVTQEMWVRSLCGEGNLKEDMAALSSILAWEIPQTEKLVGYSPQDHKKSDMTEVTEHACYIILMHAEV